MSGQQEQFVPQGGSNLEIVAPGQHAISGYANSAAQGEYQITFPRGALFGEEEQPKIHDAVMEQIIQLEQLGEGQNKVGIEYHQTTPHHGDAVAVFRGPLTPSQTEYLSQIGKTAIPSTSELRKAQKHLAWTSVYQGGPPQKGNDSTAPFTSPTYTD